jgi:hypothetical protein
MGQSQPSPIYMMPMPQQQAPAAPAAPNNPWLSGTPSQAAAGGIMPPGYGSGGSGYSNQSGGSFGYGPATNPLQGLLQGLQGGSTAAMPQTYPPITRTP